MISVNSSLLDSSSVFIELSEEEVANQSFSSHCKLSSSVRNHCNDKYAINTVCLSNSPFKNYLSDSASSHNITEPIQLTQQEAFRLLNLAASLLQAHIKRYFQQKRFKRMLMEHKAATKIQSLWKGYHVRHRDVCVYRKQLNYVTQNLQKYLTSLDEKYAKQIQLMKDEKKVMINVLFNLANDVDILKKTQKEQTIMIPCEKCVTKDNLINTQPDEKVKYITSLSQSEYINDNMQHSSVIADQNTPTLCKNANHKSSPIIPEETLFDVPIQKNNIEITLRDLSKIDTDKELKNDCVEEIVNSLVDNVLLSENIHKPLKKLCP